MFDTIVAALQSPNKKFPSLPPSQAQLMAKKACLTFHKVTKTSYRQGRVSIEFALRNDGQGHARDLSAAVVEDGLAAVTVNGPATLSAGETKLFEYSVPRPPRQDPPETIHKIHTVRFRFADDIGPDETTYVVAISGKDPEWKIDLDPSQTMLSPLCGYTIKHAPDARPRNLTADDHAVLERLLRRVVNNPRAFRPTIRSDAIGDDEFLYSLDNVSGAPIAENERQNPQHPRNFIPALVQQQLLIAASAHEYMIDDSLFRAYGLEPPS